MSAIELELACFLWGVVVGFIIHRGISTGHWSIKP
jgi:hypothetical protein